MADNFNPDAYLASKRPSSGFNPDAYLAGKHQPKRGAAPATPSFTHDDLVNAAHEQLQEMPWVERNVVGLGAALHDYWTGAKQRLGMPVDKDEVDLSRAAQQEAPVGAFVGQAAPGFAAPAGMAGAIGYGALSGMLTPTKEGESAGINAVMSGAGAGVGQKVFSKLGQAISSHLGDKAANLTTQQHENAVRDAIIREARQAGYVMPPTQARPGLMNDLLEGLESGKLKTQQKSSLMNQKVTNQLVRDSFGLTGSMPITQETLSLVRENSGNVYQTIKDMPGRFNATPEYTNTVRNLSSEFRDAMADFPEYNKGVISHLEGLITSFDQPSFTPKGAIETIKMLRHDASALFRSDDPEKIAMAKAQKKIANALEEAVESNLKEQGHGDLMKDFRRARTLIAKSYDVSSALTESGNVDALRLAQAMHDQGSIDHQLRTIVKFANTFPQSAHTPERVGSVTMFSPVDYGAGIAAGLLAHNPLYAGAAVVRPMVRRGLLTSAYQNKMVAKTPSYLPGMTAKALKALGESRYPGAFGAGAGADLGRQAQGSISDQAQETQSQ